MALDSTKQGYTLLAAFREAGDAGLDWEDMIVSMQGISTETFSNPRYVNAPKPLMTALREAVENRELALNERGLYAITARGLADCVFIEQRFIRAVADFDHA